MIKKEYKYTNLLINETSPYLLQHAHNPVEWHPWNEKTLALAKKENKPLLVSIGYSACHWCHVMEHESFEDEKVAQIMNENFICVKVDREERPDVDQVYMDAVQMISGRGGWPLNCFALPDGRPFWGATYFPKNQWIDVLDQITHMFNKEQSKLVKQAEEIGKGMAGNSFITMNPDDSSIPEKTIADEMAKLLMARTDKIKGGFKGAPKFPMPNSYLFLLNYHFYTRNHEVLQQVEITLKNMADGGIYDQIGGGFSRYSVDERWHIPHFEKMLYDNAQLVSLYSEAFRVTGNRQYMEVVKDSLSFIQRELTSAENGFYSALDADSEGVEGRYYVWTKDEIHKIAGEHGELVAACFGIDDVAYWEDGVNVLVRSKTSEELAEKFNLPEEEVIKIVQNVKIKLLKTREKRVKPGLDDKILCSWNALMIKGYIDAYLALGDPNYLNIALKNAEFLAGQMMTNDGGLFRNFKNGKATIPGFLDDYAFIIEAFISLYEVTFEEKWIDHAKNLTGYCTDHFFDKDSGMFFYVSDKHMDVITKTIEVTDNVIPASNSSLARSLHKLGLLYDNPEYLAISNQMLLNVIEKMTRYPSAFANWGILLLNRVYPFHSLVITGKNSILFGKELKAQFRPNVLLAGSESTSNMPVFKHRYQEGETLIFVCTGSECLLPVKTVSAADKLLMDRLTQKGD
jgi:uncharacterized protein